VSATFGSAVRMPELRELRYFHSVAQTGNFGRAARALNIGQPNVSYQVQKLEQELGTQLLIRHGRGVTLTPAGTRLMERLDVILGLLSAPLASAPEPERANGTISLALPSECAPLLAPRVLERSRERWPGIDLAIQEGTSGSLEEWVLDRRVDIAVLQDPPTLDELVVDPVVSERLGLVSGVRTIRLDGADSVRVRLLGDLDLILPHRRHWVRRLVESAAFRRGIVLDRVQQADGVPLIKEMVRDGLGHTILPLVAVRDEVARGTLSFLPIDRDPLTANHAIVCRSGIARSPFVTEVRQALREVMTGLARSGAWVGATVIAASTRTADPVEHSDMENNIE
jgi:LysR family transcriptional regulator, nitrogen assimilation regulatory protein